MRTQLIRAALAAGFMLALAFTLSCTQGVINDSDGISSSSAAVPVSSSAQSPAPSSSSIAIVSGTFIDSRDGKAYRQVSIGGQVWMAENLNYAAEGSKCGNGSSLSDANTTTCDTYGRLYNWATAMTACPSGWHLPSNAEWDKLSRYVDGSTGTSSPYDSPTAGRYLKATSGWNSNGNGQDTYGFSALLGGLGYSGGSFLNVGYYGYWWSSSEYGSSYAYYRYVSYDLEYAYYDYNGKSRLFSVRCLQD